jgi:hypothetical protein
MTNMTRLKAPLAFASVTILLLIAGCASTKFLSEWKDETYQERPRKILVINAFPSPATRRLFEEEFVRALQDRGLDATVSYTDMPDPIISDKHAIDALAAKSGADTVLISKPIGRTTGETSGAGGVTYTDVYIGTQTDIYDVKSDRLIMSVSAETWIFQGDPYLAQIRDYVRSLIKEVSRLGLFKG